MANGNPHDRRDRPRRGRLLGTPGEYSEEVDIGPAMPYELLTDGRQAYPGFGLARLEELLRDEYARGFNCGEGTMERRLEEEILPKARREAWDEGAREGHRGGRAEMERELLERIAEKHEKPVRAAIEHIDSALAASSKPLGMMMAYGDLCAAAEEARALLARLLHDHHQGFPGEMPF